ncbi:ATP-binding protein [Haloferax sp. S2CR25-2]|nr:ATP-binding protein [Haloferax sp. S2CR25]MDS0446782.1 ATP-binding protein [Haloferax sp. S2CR25-2]
MLDRWLTPEISISLMYLGVVPSVVNCQLLWQERDKPGVIWFILSMATGGLWSLLFATFTLIPDPQLTLAVANFFWVMIPTAAVTLFLLAYEFVFKQTASRTAVYALFTPIVLLFILSWFNPYELVFTSAYYVTADGILHFPIFDGPLKVLVTKIYGYLLVFLAAGMFVGELLRTNGTQRRQTVYLLVVFSMLVGSTLVKVAGLVPIYFDPTSVLYSCSGLFFAYSIREHGLLKFVPVAREQTFEEITDPIFVVNAAGYIVDANQAGVRLSEQSLIGTKIEEFICGSTVSADAQGSGVVKLEIFGGTRTFSIETSEIIYGRGVTGKIVVLSDITALKEREEELDLLKQVLSRIFRHNIRNDLNVIAGFAAIIRDSTSGETAQSADRIHTRAMKVVEQAAKARKIETVLSYTETDQRPLDEYLSKVEQSVSAEWLTHVSFDVDDVVVDAHPRFDLALAELIENAVSHHAGDDPITVRVTTDLSPTAATIIVEDNGPGLPPSEFAVLEAGEETDLEHGSGIGLWLVYWIVSRSNGTLSVRASESGTQVRIRLNRADSAADGGDSPATDDGRG